MRRRESWFLDTMLGRVEIRVVSPFARVESREPAAREAEERALAQIGFELEGFGAAAFAALDEAFQVLDGGEPVWPLVPSSAFRREQRAREMRLRLRDEVARSRLELRLGPLAGPLPGEPPFEIELPVGPPRSAREVVKNFISLELRDQNDAPVPKRRFRVELPDKSTLRGTTDEAGFASLNGFLPTGLAKIEFEDFEKTDFDFVPALPGQRGSATGPAVPEAVDVLGEDEDEEDVIEIELVDEGGAPLDQKKFRLTSSEGRVIENTLDDQGKAKLTGLKPGKCLLVVP